MALLFGLVTSQLLGCGWVRLTRVTRADRYQEAMTEAAAAVTEHRWQVAYRAYCDALDYQPYDSLAWRSRIDCAVRSRSEALIRETQESLTREIERATAQPRAQLVLWRAVLGFRVPLESEITSSDATDHLAADFDTVWRLSGGQLDLFFDADLYMIQTPEEARRLLALLETLEPKRPRLEYWIATIRVDLGEPYPPLGPSDETLVQAWRALDHSKYADAQTLLGEVPAGRHDVDLLRALMTVETEDYLSASQAARSGDWPRAASAYFEARLALRQGRVQDSRRELKQMEKGSLSRRWVFRAASVAIYSFGLEDPYVREAIERAELWSSSPRDDRFVEEAWARLRDLSRLRRLLATRRDRSPEDDSRWSFFEALKLDRDQLKIWPALASGIPENYEAALWFADSALASRALVALFERAGLAERIRLLRSVIEKRKQNQFEVNPLILEPFMGEDSDPRIRATWLGWVVLEESPAARARIEQAFDDSSEYVREVAAKLKEEQPK